MSRIGKKDIVIPQGVEIQVSGESVSVKGPKGELSMPVHELVEITINDNMAKVTPKNDSKFANALWGTYASHLQNMIVGVTNAYMKKLLVEGVGFRVEQKGNDIELKVGFSHPVLVSVPSDLKVEVDSKENSITITGIDKQKVGQFAADIRKIRKPEPYKGKGIRYEGEHILRKEGKRATT